jgi:hypothetical protein
MRNSHRPVYHITEHRRRVADKTPTVVFTGQPQTALDERSWIARALSWLGSAIIEGFAAYGESICPCLHDFPEHNATGSDEPPPITFSHPVAQENPWAQPRGLSHRAQPDGAERDEIGTARQRFDPFR